MVVPITAQTADARMATDQTLCTPVATSTRSSSPLTTKLLLAHLRRPTLFTSMAKVNMAQTLSTLVIEASGSASCKVRR